jgi:hypothetical protein
MWVVSILSESAALLSITGLAMTQISSIRSLVKVSYPIYLARLVCVISLGGSLVIFGFTSGILGPLVIYCAFISWTSFDWVFNGANFPVVSRLAKCF